MDYIVDVQNIEKNEEQHAVTGTVNGKQVTAVVLARLVPTRLTRRFYAGELIEAFKGVAATPVHDGMIRISEA